MRVKDTRARADAKIHYWVDICDYLEQYPNVVLCNVLTQKHPQRRSVFGTKTLEVHLMTITHERAHEVMGKNFFGIEEAVKYFGVNSSEQQLVVLDKIPFSEEYLQSVRDTHILVAIFPMSILDICAHPKCKEFFCPNKPNGYADEVFAKEKGQIGWRLVRRESVADSASKNWDEQQMLLDKTEETPRAQVMVYTIIGHFLATEERLFERIFVRCYDIYSHGSRVHVGYFVHEHLGIHANANSDERVKLGLSAAKR